MHEAREHLHGSCDQCHDHALPMLLAEDVVVAVDGPAVSAPLPTDGSICTRASDDGDRAVEALVAPLVEALQGLFLVAGQAGQPDAEVFGQRLRARNCLAVVHRVAHDLQCGLPEPEVGHIHGLLELGPTRWGVWGWHADGRICTERVIHGQQGDGTVHPCAVNPGLEARVRRDTLATGDAMNAPRGGVLLGHLVQDLLRLQGLRASNENPRGRVRRARS
mmetsp:Transcript_80228/g.259998  ORF Transcript_80228/g.259998 Transcript_80228/m.259998 type:complete len:220 (-) Transcript_80228:387-1046(-)